MKKLMLAIGLLFVVTQSNCSLFDNAMGMLKKAGGALLEKGKKYLAENSGKILSTVVTKGTEFVKSYIGGGKSASTTTPSTESTKPGIGIQEAEKLVLDTAKTESDSEEKELTTQAKNIVAATPGLTPAEQQAILQEAQNIANQNRDTLVKQAQESIAQKKEALKSSIYEKYGKGTPTQ